MTLTSIKENYKQKSRAKIEIEKRKNKPILDWLPEKYQRLYEATDLLYSHCVKIFSMVEANMREDIPETTMRSWFIEFIKAGWTQEMVNKRYEALIRNKKYGVIDFSSWVNAVPVYAEDEINRIVKQKIEALIERGNRLVRDIDKLTEVTEEDKKAMELALLKQIQMEILNEKMRKIDEYKESRKKEILKKLKNNNEKGQKK